MKTFTEYLAIMDGIHEDKARLVYAEYLSVLPMLMLIMKLMQRKNEGKKPFSSEFDYSKRREEVQETIRTISDQLDEGKVDEAKNRILLQKCKETAELAQKEIKSESLKGDFAWVEREISQTIRS